MWRSSGNKPLSLWTVLLCTVLLSGCCLKPGRPTPAPEGVSVSDIISADLSDTKTVRDKIYLQYQQWKGTRYKMGGLSRTGVDCSGFVYLTYRQQLGIELPRTTRQQAKVGAEIPANELRSGDLVFFKTGFRSRHVGIYLGNDQFVHASTKQGVMLSRLDDVYWQKTYWHARRVTF